MSARNPAFIAGLRAAVRGELREAAPLSRFSTYRIGGPATVLLPASPEDIAVAVRYAGASGVPVFALGFGSNVLLPDEGLDALVIRLGKGLDRFGGDGPRFRIGAGLAAPMAARKSAALGWGGLHMMVGVPGTVGGGIYMNAGCHGGQWSDVTVAVTAIDAAGTDRVIPASEIPFSYRRSGLDGMIVVDVEVELHPGDPPELDAEVAKLFAWRQEGTPFNQPCCGSVFKNPEPPAPEGWTRPWTAGSLIEAAGLKGVSIGGVQVSPMHANYFVNTGKATSADVRTLIAKAREAVHARFGVTLETEVKQIGPAGEYLSVTSASR